MSMHQLISLISATLLVTLSTTARSVPPTILTSASVFDANGSLVGAVESSDPFLGIAYVLMTKNGRVFRVPMNRNGLFAISESFYGSIYFFTPDCSGTAYFANRAPFGTVGLPTKNQWASALVVLGTVASPGKTIYTPNPESPIYNNLSYQSRRTATGCISGTGTVNAVSASSQGNLQGVYKTPFYVR